MLIVEICSVVLAALRSASGLWTATVSTIGVALLLSSSVAAMLLRGPSRSAWVGCAVMVWGFHLASRPGYIGGDYTQILDDLLASLAALVHERDIAPEAV